MHRAADCGNAKGGTAEHPGQKVCQSGIQASKRDERQISGRQRHLSGSQLASAFGGDRCFGPVSNMEFLLVCTYKTYSVNPELIIYKER